VTSPPAVHRPVRDVTIGLFGRRSLVATMLEAGEELRERDPDLAVRFVTGVQTTTAESREKFERLADRIDAAVFPGPLHFDLAGAGGYRSVPSSFVRLTGGALYSTLLRAMLHDDLDVRRVSVDSLPADAVAEAFRELALGDLDVPVAPYGRPEDVQEYFEFHREAQRSGRATCALTTISEVEEALTAAGLPVVRITPTLATVRDAVAAAVSHAHGTRLVEQQIAFIVVQLISPSTDGAPAVSTYWQQQGSLEVHRVLLDEARTVGATVARRSDTEFVVTTTAGGVGLLTGRLMWAPFLHAVRERVGIPVAIGLGTGRTAHAAESNAFIALEESARAEGTQVVLIDADGERTGLGLDGAQRERPTVPVTDKTHSLGTRVLHGLQDRDPQVASAPYLEVGAEEVAQALDVTARSGLRTIKQLVEAGYAWPLPPQPSPTGGRPRQRYRLLTSKLTPASASEEP